MLIDNSIEFAEQSESMSFRLMSTFLKDRPMTREKYMNCRADIDNALNSSEFCIQSMYLTGLPSFQLLITKLDENDTPVPVTIDDVSFLKRRFENDGIPVKFKQLRSFASFAFYHDKAVGVAEFHSTC